MPLRAARFSTARPGIGVGWGVLGIVAGAYALSRILKSRVQHLDDHVVLITGGSRGLGLLLAREFGQRGARLAICARDPVELERARLNLVRRGFEVFAVPCDVGNPIEVQALIAQVLERFGRLDVLVNNAGVIQVGPLASMGIEDFRAAMATNFWGTVHTTLAALDALRSHDGRLVNICSIGGKVAMPHLLPYDSAKAAVLAFSEGLRMELAGEGVSVTTVVPGLMRTGSYTNALFKGADPAGEFQWFKGLSQSTNTTLDVREAAKRIVLATERREPELILGWQARVLGLAKAIMPSTIFRILSTASRFMPRGHGPTNGMAGKNLALAANRDRWH